MASTAEVLGELEHFSKGDYPSKRTCSPNPHKKCIKWSDMPRAASSDW